MSIAWTKEVGVPKPPKPKPPKQPWEEPPWSNVSAFETENCVYYVLAKRLDMQEGVDFLYQKRIPVKGINLTGLNRTDFWVLPSGKGAAYGVGASPYWFGRILNPIASTALIHDPARDRFERELIRKQHYDIIYMLDWMLYDAPVTTVEDALRGYDKSGR